MGCCGAQRTGRKVVRNEAREVGRIQILQDLVVHDNESGSYLLATGHHGQILSKVVVILYLMP